MKEITKKIISLTKRRGFVFPCSEIYGGVKGLYDFGPLGVEMKRNLKNHWWKYMRAAENNVGFDSALILNPKVWEASGHLSAGFADELMECKSCHKRFKAEDLEGDECPECGGELTEPKNFNLMMKTFTGPVEDDAHTNYLRAETCQGIFINFKNILESRRLSIPFGVIQEGKSFRNEITPGNFIFRMREFEQMEMEWFCTPEKADEWFDFWLDKRLEWYKELGLDEDKLRKREIPEEERAHYAKRQSDLEYKFPFGWQEIEGIHNRGDWDLSTHSEHSNKELSYYDQKEDKKYFPYVIETSVGVERALFAFLVDAFRQVKGGRSDKSDKEEETVLNLSEKIAPIKIAVFPLVKNEEKIVGKAKEVYEKLAPHFNCNYDEKGSIGRRYRRADETGIPYALTIDFDTLEQDDLTIRDRDTMEQERVKIENLVDYFKDKFD